MRVQEFSASSRGSQTGSSYAPADNRPEGVVYSYDAQGWVARSATYSGGLLDGEERIFGPVGDPLFTLPAPLATDLAGGLLSDGVHQAFAAGGVVLFDDAVLQSVEPGREYLVTQTDTSYSVRVGAVGLAICHGRLLRRTVYQDNLIRARISYKAGRLNGEIAIYGPLAAPLFCLDPALRADLDAGAVKKLQSAFSRHLLLADDALVLTEMAGVEWRITQAGRMLTVRAGGGTLAVYPGRVVVRAAAAVGWATETAQFRDGLLDGERTLYRAAGQQLFQLDRVLSKDLNQGRIDALRPLFEAQELPLGVDAVAVPVMQEVEWFVKQAGPTYTVRRVKDYLAVFPGRVVTQTGYKAGEQDGISALYDAGGALTMLATFAAGRLHGPLTTYSGPLKQSLVTFQGGRKEGPSTVYDEQGRPVMVAHYRNDRLDGGMATFKAGQKQATSTYHAGKQDGPTATYYDNGQVLLSEGYKDGLRDGESLVYSEGGQLLQQRGYKNGLLDGESLLYDGDGHLMARSRYQAGLLEGVALEYYPSGVVRKRSHYLKGKLDGSVNLYDQSGQLTEIRHYRDGLPVGQAEKPTAGASSES